MIAGFNTDVEHNGTVYHVQTEDKGLSTHMIVSLVYDRGTILASKRTTYDDLTAGQFDEKALAERVARQHKLICAAVRAGRIDELKKMSGRPAVQPSVAAAIPVAESTAVVAETLAPVGVPVGDHRTLAPEAPPIELPETDDPFADAPIIEEVIVLDDIDLLPLDAVEVVTELAGRERPRDTKLKLVLIGETRFKGGDHISLNLMVCRGSDQKVVPGAQIMVKILGSAFRPVIFHARSDSNGMAQIHMQVPRFNAGRAALLVRAIADGEEVEARRLVSPG